MLNSEVGLANFDGQPSLYSPGHIALLSATLRAAEANAAVFGSTAENAKPFQFHNGMAIIPITGVLLNRFNYVSSWVSGYDGIRRLFDAALADPDVKGIAFDVNCHGGMVQGCFELADYIDSKRGEKRMVAIVDANAHSAAYALASAVGTIVATRSASVGSIGVVQTHVDYSKALENEGVKVTFIYAGKHKVDGNPYEKLSKEVREEMQAKIETMYDEFVSAVARYRGMDEKDVRATEAATYRAEEALSVGLIDEISDSVDAFEKFSSELKGSVFKPTGVFAMAEDKQEAAASTGISEQEVSAREATAASKARDEERARIKGILASPEATGRESLARHFAFDTALSVEAVEAALKAAPTEKATSAENPFAAAMATGNPDVGAHAGPSSEPGAEAGAEDASARMLRNWAALTGRKIN